MIASGDHEERYRALLDAARDGLVIHDYGRVIEANESAGRMFGYSSTEAIGYDVLSFLVEHERERVLARAIGGDEGPYETIGLRKDGSTFPIEITGRAVEYGGRPLRAISFRDLTERKKAEAALRETAEEFRAIFENSAVGKGQADPATGRLLRANKKLCELTGYTAGELLARTFTDLAHPDDRKEDGVEFKRLVDGEIAAYDREKRYVRKGGEVLWVRVTVNLLRDAAGNPARTNGVVLDVTARKRAEAELRLAKERAEVAERDAAASRTQLIDAIETLPEGFALFDREDRLVLWNSRYKDIYSVSAPGVVPGARFEDMVRAGMRRGMVIDSIGREDAWLAERLARHREPYGCEEQQLANGRWLRVQERRTADGGSVGVRIDITELKQRATELKLFNDTLERRVLERARELEASERRFRLVFDTLTQGIVFQDSQGTIIEANPAAARILGLGLDELPGLVSGQASWRASDASGEPLPGDRHPTMVALRTAQVVRGFVMGVFNPRLKERRWIVVDAIPLLRPGESRPFQVYSLFSDITEMRRGEEELRTLAERQTAILDALPAHVAFLDHEATIISVNKAWLRFAVENGLTDGRGGSGCNYLEVCEAAAGRGDTEAAEVAKALREILAGTRERFERDYPCYGPQAERWFRLVAAPVAPGRLGGAVVLHLDITQARLGEAALHQSLKIESIGHLTGGIAHDFNNLLTAVIGNLELLKRYVTAERAQRYLSGALSAAERGATLTQRLLAFARRQRLEAETIDAAALVAGMEGLLAQSVGPLVAIRQSFPPELWRVRVDRNQLELVLLNLALNARDAMPNGGTLSIAAANERIAAGGQSGLSARDYVRFSVTDTGTGMTPEVLTRVGEPFFTTKEAGGGSGLGLAMTRGFVEQSGGEMRIRSAQGQGATIEFWLPRSSEPAPAVPAVLSVGTIAPAGPRKATVLVIDDDREVRDFVGACLEEAGYRVLAAASGPEGLARLKEDTVDLLITDFAMPGMNGGEVISQARTSNPALPVLIVTGYVDARVLERIEYPMLQKPFMPEQLLKRALQLLQRDTSG